MLQKTRLALSLEAADINADLGAEAAALGRAAASVVQAALDAAARMQAALLTPQALGVHHGDPMPQAQSHACEPQTRCVAGAWTRQRVYKP